MTTDITVERMAVNEYQEAVLAATKLAAQTHNLNFSPLTQESWLNAMLLIYYVDDSLDSGKLDVKTAKDGLRSIFLPNINSEDKSTNLSPQTQFYAEKLKTKINNKQARVFLRKGFRIIDECASWRQTEDPREYMNKVKLIGQLQASMFCYIADPDDRKEPAFRSFTYFFRHAGRVATGIDAIIDLDGDYKDGLVSVEPSLGNRLIMASEIAGDTWDGARRIGLGKTTLVVSKTVIKSLLYKKWSAPNGAEQDTSSQIT